MSDNNLRLFAQVTKGPRDTVSAAPREQPPTFHTATVVGVDSAQNTCNVQLNLPAGLPTQIAYKVRCTHGYKPKVGETCKILMTHPVPSAVSNLLVPDPYISVT